MKIFKKGVIDWGLFMFCMIIVSCSFGMFLNMHFSVDSYSVYYNEDPSIHIRNTRYINYLITIFLNNLGFNFVINQKYITLVLIGTISCFIYYLTTAILKLLNEKNKTCSPYILASIIALSFCNTFVLEWFLYPETTLFYSVSLIFCIMAIAVWNLNKRKINFISATIFLTLSLFCYQATFPFFGIYIFIFICVQRNFIFNKTTNKVLLETICIIGISCVFMLLAQKFIVANEEARTASFSIQNILTNFKQLFLLQFSLLYNANGFFPPVLLVVSLIVLICIYISLYKKGFGRKNSFCFVLFSLLFYALIFSPHLLSHNLWLAPRTMVSFFSIFSALGIFILEYSECLSVKKIISSTIIILLLIVNIITIQAIGINHFISNYLDKQIATILQKYIQEYEQDTGTSVTQIGTVFDQSPSYFYSGINYVKYDTNTKCYCVDWGDVNAINYYNNTNYKKNPI